MLKSVLQSFETESINIKIFTCKHSQSLIGKPKEIIHVRFT